MEFEPTPMAALRIDDFAHCIRENHQSKISGYEGLKDVIIMDANLEAARTGERVEIG